MSTHLHSVTTWSEQPTTSFTRSIPDLWFDSFTQTILIEDICAVNTHVHTFNNFVGTWMGVKKNIALQIVVLILQIFNYSY